MHQSKDIAIRPASLSKDRQELIAVLERNFPGPATGFGWRHEENPAGPGWSWVVYDRQSGSVRAMASVFPRRAYVDGKPVVCGQVGEFAVDRGYRSLGPALMLQRATFHPVDTGELAFCYDCPPHDRGMATFVRLGMFSLCEVVRYTYLLRSDQYLTKKFGNGLWTKPLTTGANVLLGMRRTSREIAGLDICLLPGKFGDEFTYLDTIVPSRDTIRTSRAADLLNWRYRQRHDPEISGVDVLVARCSGELVAFLIVVAYRHGRASISDLFGQRLEEVGLPLLSEAIAVCRRKKLIGIDGCCSEKSELQKLLKAAGFRARERAARVVGYARSNVYELASWSARHAEIYI